MLDNWSVRTIPKAGKYDYPFYDLNKVLGKLEKVHGLLREDELERNVVADTLGMSERGGGFMYTVSSMEKYGLVKIGGGKIMITQLGKVALYGDEAEKKRVKHNAVLNVDLFKSLYNQYGKQVTTEQIRAFLRQKAFVEVDRAQKMAEFINKIYKKVSIHILSADTPLQSSTSVVEGQGRRETMVPFEPHALKIQYRNVLIQIPQDDIEAIEFAEKALAFMKKEILDKTQSKEQTDG